LLSLKTIQIISAFIVLLCLFNFVKNAGAQPLTNENQTIICLLNLEHADADQFVPVLSSFLSPQGKITAYSPTNTLIISDRAEMVKKIVKVVKGHSDLSDCGK
jgi:type II secretory pathway component GspD/PulD (secretin)